MAIKRIILIVAIFIVLTAFTIAPALAFLDNAQNVQRIPQNVQRIPQNATTKATTNSTVTPSAPPVNPAPLPTSTPTLTPVVIVLKVTHSSEVAASSTEKSQ